MELTKANEHLDSCILPVNQIGDVNEYCQGIVKVQSEVDSISNKLNNAKENLAYFKRLRKEYFNK